MLDVAIKHKDRLLELFRETWFVDKYKYWNCGNYYEDWNPVDSTWINHQFVSLDSSGNVIGYIGYQIDRTSEFVYGLNIINLLTIK